MIILYLLNFVDSLLILCEALLIRCTYEGKTEKIHIFDSFKLPPLPNSPIKFVFYQVYRGKNGP